MKVGTRKVQNLLRAKKYEIGSGRKSTKLAPSEKVRNWLRAKGTKFGTAKKVETLVRRKVRRLVQRNFARTWNLRIGYESIRVSIGKLRAKCGRSPGESAGEKVRNWLRAKKYEIGSGRKSTKFGPAKKSRKYKSWSGQEL